jgi:hypothetical protein
MRDLRWWSGVGILGMASLCGISPVASAQTSGAPSAIEAHGETGTRAADIITIDWRVLRTLDFKTGQVSDTLRSLERKLVRLAGFVVPLEDFQERAKEFLLVPYFGACVHLPPPPPNQLVYVTLQSTTRISTWEPVWIEGTLQVINYKSIYGVAGFQMRVDRIVPYEKTGKWP